MKRDTLTACLFWFLTILFIFLLNFSKAMTQGLNHDEHQFVASGKLLSEHFLLPYKDYPYFHMPNLVLVYGLLFKATDYLLLGARLFSVVCGTLTVAVVIYLALGALSEKRTTGRLLTGLGAGALLMTNSLFDIASGLAWNHDLPTLLTLVAFMLCSRAFNKRKPCLYLAIAGLAIGFAAGVRLTYAPVVIPIVAVVLLDPSLTDHRSRVKSALYLALGIFVGLAPAIAAVGIASEAFVFGNFEYRLLDILLLLKGAHYSSIGFFGKLSFAVTEVLFVPNNFILFFAWILAIVSVTAFEREASRAAFELRLLFLLPIFLLIGSFAPTPLWYHYFYAPTPFMILGVVYGLALHKGQTFQWAWKLFAAVVVASVFFGDPDYRHLSKIYMTKQWLPILVHSLGEEIKSIAGDGKVLTFAPILPLEAGLKVYPELVVGPFAYRTAEFVPKDKRARLHIAGREDLPELLKTVPPQAVLLGFEDSLELDLRQFAKTNGYNLMRLPSLPRKIELWVAP